MIAVSDDATKRVRQAAFYPSESRQAVMTSLAADSESLPQNPARTYPPRGDAKQTELFRRRGERDHLFAALLRMAADPQTPRFGAVDAPSSMNRGRGTV